MRISFVKKNSGILFNGCVYICLYCLPGEIHQVGGNCKMIVGPANDHIEKHVPLKSDERRRHSFRLTQKLTGCLDKVYFILWPQ